MRTPKLLIAAAAMLGLGTAQAQSTAETLRPTEQRQTAAVKNGTTARELKEDLGGSYAGGMLRALTRDRGHTPKEWGMSRACARMVLKNRMRRA